MPQYSETTFQGEYLRELHIARHQLLALAEAVPLQSYSWKPVDGVRTFAAILVHVAVGNVGLLLTAGVRVQLSAKLYPPLAEVDPSARMLEMIRRNVELEGSLTSKPDVIDLLTASFDEVEQALRAADEAHLQQTLPALRGRGDGFFFGNETTARRVYFRILTHTHEHMGQAIAYVRMMGLKAPWPDPLSGLVA